MNPFFMMNNPMMQVIQQYRQIKQNPNQLASFLKQRGMISDNQVNDISKMCGNYQQIGQYLMQQGRMPQNIEQYQNQVDQIQNMMK